VMNLSDVYYFAKPAIPLSIRLALRGVLASHLRKKHSRVWPINEAAGHVPARWPGWPEGKQFAFVVTHDVEGTRGLERCRALAELEASHGFRSAFNFVPEGEYRVSVGLRKFLTTNGFEVGVHDLHHDGTLYRSEKGFKEAAERINQYVREWNAVGFRSGFMRHNLEWLDKLEVFYDSSTFDTDPLEPQPDGVDTIFPFWVSQDGRHGYVEIPYTLPQDSTLFLLLRERSIDVWKRKVDWVAQKGGLALVNVHPDYMNFNGHAKVGEYRHQLYLDLLQYVSSHYGDRCWYALPGQVAHYFYEHMVGSSGIHRCLAGRNPANSASTLQRPTSGGALLDDRTVGAAGVVHSVSSSLQGKRMAVVLFSSFPGDPRPRRAAEAFSQEGMQVEVICLVDEGDRKQDTFAGIHVDRLSIEHIRTSKLGYVMRYGRFIVTAFAKLAVRCLTKRYQIVHIHNMPDVLVFAALIPKCLGAKVILDLHDPMPELMMTIFNLRKESLAVRAMTVLEKWSIRFADAVLTVNEACEKLFVGRGCPSAKISVVMNTPDETVFKRVPPEINMRQPHDGQTRFIIMYHGTLVERNGVDLAVDALAKIQTSVPLVELRIYGPRTPFLDHVMQGVHDKGLEKAVHYLGPRRLEQLGAAIAECDVGVIPNRRSIFTEINTPTRIFEYLALGKPVVAPRAPGILDYFGEESMVFFELGNADDLAEKLLHLYRRPDDAYAIVSRGQEVCLAHSWQKEREKLLGTTSKLLNVDSL